MSRRASRRLLLLVVPVLVTAVLAPVAPAGAAVTTRACKGQEHFRCGTVTVPLDRSGRVPGTLKLAVAIERRRPGTSGYLVALSGGPGQPAVPYAESFRQSLAPALRQRRLVVFDQRGTGASGVLRCPSVQGLGTLDVVNTRLVERCAQRLGAKRQAYGTADTVEDLDAVRAALGAEQVDLMGISYGTFVALHYLRGHADRTGSLILDSVVAPEGVDPYFLDTFTRLPRILREQCAAGRCRGATADPLADLAKLTARLQRGPIRGTVVDDHGRRRATAIHDESELALMLMSGDLNPWLQSALPAAIASAVRGDRTPLLRLRRPADGPATGVADFSVGLNVTTTCGDVRLPYGLGAPFTDRFAAWRHGTDAVPTTAFAPFSREAVIDTSVAHDCLRWPQGDVFGALPATPPADHPMLVLSGRWDTRTPTENARALMAGRTQAQLVTVGGTGHDVLDADITGCAAKALRRFADGKRVGTPCRGRTNAVPMLTRPARRLSDYRPARGVAGRRGRLVNAVLDAIADGQNTALQTLFAGFDPVRAGGLRGGVVTAPPSIESMRLQAYALVPDIAVTGRIRATARAGVGRFAVDGPGRRDGVLRLHADGTVSGVVGGRKVRTIERGAGGARSAGRLPMRLRGGRELARLVRSRSVAR